MISSSILADGNICGTEVGKSR